MMQIFANDLNTDTIDQARQDYFPTSIADDVPTERHEHFFMLNVDGYRVGKEIRETVVFPAQSNVLEASKTLPTSVNLQTVVDQLLLQQFSPAAVLVSSEGDIVYISGRTGKYLEPAAGKANWNIHAMAREGLRQELALILPKVLRNKGTLIQPGIRLDTPNGIQTVNLTVHAIEQPETLRGMTMIMFSDVEASEPEPAASGKRPSARGRLGTQERFLQQAFDEVQRLQEQVQTQQEELRSANEALQSILEELQCTHEELTATKGEMQSLDEELQTVNIELQHKVYDLLTLKSDMNNLLDSTGIATVFLDNALKVRRFTPQATKIFKLFPGDVGRSLSDIVTDLNYPALQADQWEVLRTLSHSEKQIVTHDGRWFKVKIMPFCTPDNVIDGVVIILNDISIAKSLEA